jgi:hypothetical protein
MVMINTDIENRIENLRICRKGLTEKLMAISVEDWNDEKYEDEQRTIHEDLIEIDYEIYLLTEELNKEKKQRIMSTILTIVAAIGAVAIATFLAIKLVHFIEEL